jgi:hypothetical protein
MTLKRILLVIVGSIGFLSVVTIGIAVVVFPIMNCGEFLGFCAIEVAG